MDKKEFQDAVFKANRDRVLELQEIEKYLEENLREVREEKSKYLKKLQEDGACSHGIVLEMQRVLIAEHPDIERRRQKAFRVRVCQLCGYRGVLWTEEDRIGFGALKDENLRDARIIYPHHSHWTVEEYMALRPLHHWSLQKHTGIKPPQR